MRSSASTRPTARAGGSAVVAVVAVGLVLLGVSGPHADDEARRSAGAPQPVTAVVAPADDPVPTASTVRATPAGPRAAPASSGETAAATTTVSGPGQVGDARTPQALAPGADPSAGPGIDEPVDVPVDADPQDVPDVVEGQVVRAWAEVGHVAPADGEHTEGTVAAGQVVDGPAAALAAGERPGLLTWVHTDDGLAVQVPTDDLREVTEGSRVRVRLTPHRDPAGPGAVGPQAREAAGFDVLSAQVLSRSPSSADALQAPLQASEDGDQADRAELAGPVAAPAPEESARTDQQTLAAVAPHQVTVVMVAPSGQPADATTLSAVVSAVEGGVSQFWSGQTAGAVSFDVVQAVDWITTTATCGSNFTLWNEVASRVGWTSGAGKHLLLYVSGAGSPASCYSGLGTVGSGPTSGGMAYVRSISTAIIAHELGHNMGLGHSDGLLCAGSPDGTFASTWSNGCTAYGYRDYYDVMGISWGNLGTLSAPNATAMGAMTTAARIDATAPLRATLLPMAGMGGMRTIRIVDGTATYWVEYRPATGQDAFLATSSNWVGLAAGVVVRRSNPADSRGSLLLDATPSPTVNTGDWAAVVPPGGSFRTALGRYTVKVEHQDTGSATVSVAVDGVWPAVSTAPVQLYSPAAGSSVPAGAVSVTGTGTAPEGTLLFEVTRSGGGVAASGFVTAGANGSLASFATTVTLPAGGYTVAVWVPEESEGESPLGPRIFEVRRSFTVS